MVAEVIPVAILCSFIGPVQKCSTGPSSVARQLPASLTGRYLMREFLGRLRFWHKAGIQDERESQKGINLEHRPY